MWRVRYLIVAISCAFGTQSHAEDCSKALIVDTYIEGSTASRDYRLSEFVSETQYDDLRAKLGVNAVIYGVPVGGKYEEYKASSREMLRKTDQHLSEHQARNILWTGLGGTSLEGYKTCLQSNRSGLFFFVRSATAEQLELVVRYSAATDAKPLELRWSGGTEEIRRELPKEVATYEEIPVVIKRPGKGEELLIAMNVVGGKVPPPEAIRITGWPNPPPPLPLAPCVKLNARQECVRCEFKLKEAGINGGVEFTRLCPQMALGEMVAANFSGNVEVRRIDQGSGCWPVGILKLGNNTKIVLNSSTPACSFTASGELGFMQLDKDALPSVGFLFHQCQWGGGPSTCSVDGQLAIWTPAGQ